MLLPRALMFQTFVVLKDPLIYSYVPVTALYARLEQTAQSALCRATQPAGLLYVMPGT